MEVCGTKSNPDSVSYISGVWIRRRLRKRRPRSWTLINYRLVAVVVHLVQALAKDSVNARLWLVSRGAQPVAQQKRHCSVTQSPIWGLGRVIALEHPELWGGLIDLEEGSDEAAQVSQLWQEIGNDDPDAEDQIAFRDNRRYVPRLVRWRFVTAESAKSQIAWPAPQVRIFAPDGAYLITGGLGRLGLNDRDIGWRSGERDTWCL